MGRARGDETPTTSAATTSAMALVAITDFVLLNRSGFIYSSFHCGGQAHRGTSDSATDLKSLAGLTRWLAGPRRGSVARPSDRSQRLRQFDV